MSEENVERLRAVYAEWAKGDFRAGGELFAPDARYEAVAPDQTPAYGPEGIKDRMRQFLAQWDEFRIEAEAFADFGEAVLVTERQHAIGKSSRVELQQAFYAVWRFRDGRVISARWDSSREGALKAAGLSE